MIFDVAIIGGGPVGLAAIQTLAPSGMKIVVFEKNKVGGTCLNEGCMPTKSLLHSASVFANTQTAKEFGVHAEQATFNYKEVVARKDQMIAALLNGSEQKVKMSGVTLVQAEATLDGESKDGLIQIQANNERYQAKKLIIGSGSENFVPPIPGLKEAEYISSREALQLQEVPKTLTVIGGGVLGMEFASLFSTFGAKVDLIEMSEEILPSFDPELAAELRKYYATRGITFHTGAKAEKVDGKTITVSKAGKTYTLTNELILLAVGRKPATESLGLESLGIKMDRSAIVVNEQMRSSHPNVYACGDSIGGSMLAHTGLQEGAVAAMSILGMPAKLNYKTIPAAVYTSPELASVGYQEKELIAEHIPYEVVKAPMAASGRFILDNTLDTPGIFKALIHKESKVILGIHILGNPASELIAIGGMAIAQNMTVDQLRSNVFPHPTASAIFSHAF
ncbi:MAG: dihydrolipoyl dehydrogenase [Bacteroides sp.]